jgi:hypothetical protein
VTDQPYAATAFLRAKKRETTRRPCALFTLASPFNLPVTTEKLKLRPSGSDGIGSAFPRETKPDCSDYHRARGEEEAERSRVSCKLKSTTASPSPSPVQPLPPAPSCCVHRGAPERGELVIFKPRNIYTCTRQLTRLLHVAWLVHSVRWYRELNYFPRRAHIRARNICMCARYARAAGHNAVNPRALPNFDAIRAPRCVTRRVQSSRYRFSMPTLSNDAAQSIVL